MNNMSLISVQMKLSLVIQKLTLVTCMLFKSLYITLRHKHYANIKHVATFFGNSNNSGVQASLHAPRLFYKIPARLLPPTSTSTGNSVPTRPVISR